MQLWAYVNTNTPPCPLFFFFSLVHLYCLNRGVCVLVKMSSVKSPHVSAAQCFLSMTCDSSAALSSEIMCNTCTDLNGTVAFGWQ